MAKKKIKKNIRASYAVVCEGYTEWYYFDYVKSKRRYPFKLKPEMPVHSHYKCIFDKARSLLNREEYNAVFCVFDLDKIKSDNQVEEFINACKKNKNNKIIPVLSFPCIEIWFLFHYQDKFSSRYYENYESLLSTLKLYVPDYCKEQKYYKKGTFFAELDSVERLEHAHLWAKKSLNEIENFRSPFDKTFTEIGFFEKFLEQCKTCVSITNKCESCCKEYFSSSISKKK